MTMTARGTNSAKRLKARIGVTAGRDITSRTNDVSVSRLKDVRAQNFPRTGRK